MLLYLLRHADAEQHASSDATRALTPKGVEQAKRVGQFCRRHGLEPSVILTSPLARAAQTARLFAAEVDEPEIVVAPFLASGMQPETALQELKAYNELNSLMLVGHEPDFSHLAAKLLGIVDSQKINIRKASLTLLEVDHAKAHSAVLQFSIPAKLM